MDTAYLEAQLSAVKELHEQAKQANDPIGILQYGHRIEVIESDLKELRTNK